MESTIQGALKVIVGSIEGESTNPLVWEMNNSRGF